MIRTALLAFAVSATMATSAVAASVAYVARNGSGVACTLAAPCVSIQGAMAVAGAGGEVICLDKGNYGGANINFSIAISCGDGLWEGPGHLININTPAGADVVIEGFVSDALTLGGGATVNFTNQGRLHLHRVRIGNAPGASSHGIFFAPAGGATLHVSNSVLYKNGGSGILIKPTSGGSANVTVSRTDLTGNFNGIFVDGSGGGNGVNLNVHDSLVIGSTNSGIPIVAPSVPVTVLIDRTTVNYSFNTGVAAAGTGALVRIGNSTISNNVTGVLAFSGAIMRSYKNNLINANSTDGTPLPAEGLN